MKVRVMAQCALFASLMCVCAWLSIPMGDTSFTMQTFALFLSLFLLGGRLGSVVCLVYLLLGAVGLPVFSGFRGGMGILLGATGGYIWGFLAASLLYWLVTAVGGGRLVGAVAGLIVCYACGTLWYWAAFLTGGGVTVGVVLARCVLPYLLPDGIKLTMAWLLAKRLRKVITNPSGT